VPTPERSGLLNVGPQAPDYDSSGPNLGFAVLKDLLMLLWPFVYSLSPPLFLLALALVGAFEIYATETFDGIVPMTNLRAVILGRLWSMKTIKAF
jgi:hypothetical protein